MLEWTQHDLSISKLLAAVLFGPVISLEGKSRVHQNYHILRAVCLDNNLHSDLWNSC